jgi:hypothetical protein
LSFKGEPVPPTKTNPGKVYKLFRVEIKGVDEDAGTVSAVVSSERVDRDGDIIRVDGWDLKNFNEANAPLLSSHNYGKLQSVIGNWPEMKVQGKRLLGTARYMLGRGNAEADWGFELAKDGLAVFSVGFRPDMALAEKIDGSDDWWPSYEFKGQELLEVSQVTIPANPDARQRAKSVMTHPVLSELLDDALGDEIGSSLPRPGFSDEDVHLIADAVLAKLTPFIVNEFQDLAEDLAPDGPLRAAVKTTLQEQVASWHPS